MPIGIGAPVARMSTMIVDGDLDMGSNIIKVDEIQNGDGGAEVTFSDDIRVDTIGENTATNGTLISEPSSVPTITLSASDTVRRTASGEVSEGGSVPVVAHTLYVPWFYEEGSVVRVKANIRVENYTYTASIRIYVNDVAVGSQHDTTIESFTTITEDLVVNPLDKIESRIWTPAASIAHSDSLTLSGDDTIGKREAGDVW